MVFLCLKLKHYDIRNSQHTLLYFPNRRAANRTVYAFGAGHDGDNTGYISKILNSFESAGIRNTRDIPAHGSPKSDVAFTFSNNSSTAGSKLVNYIPTKWERDDMGVRVPVEFRTKKQEADWRITSTVDQIKADLKANPLEKGEQFNLTGYSTGSVTMAQAALTLANSGQVIDNLILIGTPILNNSDLLRLGSCPHEPFPQKKNAEERVLPHVSIISGFSFET